MRITSWLSIAHLKEEDFLQTEVLTARITESHTADIEYQLRCCRFFYKNSGKCNKMQSALLVVMQVCNFHRETGSPDLGESQQVKFITLYPFASSLSRSIMHFWVLRWTFTLDAALHVRLNGYKHCRRLLTTISDVAVITRTTQEVKNF